MVWNAYGRLEGRRDGTVFQYNTDKGAPVLFGSRIQRIVKKVTDDEVVFQTQLFSGLEHFRFRRQKQFLNEHLYLRYWVRFEENSLLNFP